MGLDLVVIILLAGCALHGFGQGFVRGVSSFLTPVISIWLSLRHARTIASWFSPQSALPTVSLVLAILVILIVTFLGMRLLQCLVSRVFDALRIWELDRFLGCTFGLVRATALLWVVLAFVFIAYPDGRREIYRSPVAMQILVLGEGVPFLHQKMNEANVYVTALANPLKRYELPTLPSESDSTAVINLRAIQGLRLLED